MDSTNSKSKSINLPSLSNNNSNSLESTPLSNSVENIKSDIQSPKNFIQTIGWGRLFLILLILAILGINIFSGLSNITEWIGNTLGPFFKKVLGIFGLATVKTTKAVVDTASTGAKTGIDIAQGTLDSGLDVIEDQLNKKKNDLSSSDTSTTLSTALSEATPQLPQPDDATSSTQKNQNKSGFCYIGEDRGFRSCIKVDEMDQCMSGEIFPSQALCVNPNLRE